jgi:hypothetical protein
LQPGYKSKSKLAEYQKSKLAGYQKQSLLAEYQKPKLAGYQKQSLLAEHQNQSLQSTEIMLACCVEPCTYLNPQE